MPGHSVAETDLDDENTSDTEFRYDEATQTIVAESACGRQAGGVMADSVERAAARSRALAAIMGAVEVLEYTEATAVQHALLIAHARRSGRARGAHDLIIAAHAAQTGRVLLSRDAAVRFADLPGVVAEQT